MRLWPVAGTGEKGWGNSGPVTRASLHSSPANDLKKEKKEGVKNDGEHNHLMTKLMQNVPN